MGTRTTRDGRTVMDVQTSPAFDVDDEAAEMFMAFEFDCVLKEHENGDRPGPISGYLYYARMGIISLAPQAVSTVDEIMRRTWWKWRNGWFGQVSTEELLRESVAFRQADLFLNAA